MLKMILLLARRTFIRLLLVLLPLGLFAFLAQAIPLSPLQSLVVLIPMMPEVVADGNLITGQDPFSSEKMAETVMGRFNQ